MPHSFGYRARTRDLFAKKPGKKGTIALGTYLRVYKRGDYVDVIGDGAVHKGMPHKFYHGKTGVVWNVSKRAIGVIINKQVGGRIIPKKIHVRVEHVRPSTSREQFKARVKANAEKYAKWKAEGGIKPTFKRQPEGPKAGGLVDVSKTKVEQLHAEPFISFFV